MIENQKSYERGLNDLKLVCDAYIDKLKHSKEKVPIGKFIVQIDNRNKKIAHIVLKDLVWTTILLILSQILMD